MMKPILVFFVLLSTVAFGMLTVLANDKCPRGYYKCAPSTCCPL